ncbi:MAG: hypothetical protein AVDCRST_MAG03-1945 [uncultured Rubrobacteraceae bacterium]|uniref:Uncharacterized protein n=1 Tax=uncultured Rubrobacteraceae bacterium TaxID=349277 RepID=A0A6J4PGJ2_9ACTN|nr:MAG: hypothetical protein AVDCRST_MAG03-1945 [uncultured Rubrobacteraceae bacterium]
MTEAMRPEPCQVGSKTEHPCPRPAVMEVRGIFFCEPCARRQEAYFAIGELTRGKQGLGGGPLAEALSGLRRERAGGTSSRPGATGARQKRPGRGAVRSGSA